MQTFLNISAAIARLAPAQPCVLCGAMSCDGLCCAACRNDLPRLPQTRCPVCALPSSAADICGKCLKKAPAFARTVAAFRYSFPVSQLIKALKFREQLILVNFLADELAQQVEVRPDCLIAVPLHPQRLRWRGFNQSQLLAARIAKRLDIPLLKQSCRRVRDTPPQSSLPWKARDKNMRGAFEVTQAAHIGGKHVAIVDDVMTSGASLNELARALKKAGAREVSALVVARTLPHR